MAEWYYANNNCYVKVVKKADVVGLMVDRFSVVTCQRFKSVGNYFVIPGARRLTQEELMADSMLQIQMMMVKAYAYAFGTGLSVTYIPDKQTLVMVDDQIQRKFGLMVEQEDTVRYKEWQRFNYDERKTHTPITQTIMPKDVITTTTSIVKKVECDDTYLAFRALNLLHDQLYQSPDWVYDIQRLFEKEGWDCNGPSRCLLCNDFTESFHSQMCYNCNR